MSKQLSAEQVLKEYRQRLPGRAGEIFFELRQQTIMLVAAWEMFRDLFASGEEPVRVMNRSSGFLFRYVGGAMIRDTQLRLAKLTDPPATGRGKKAQANASLQRLLQELGDAGESAMVDALEPMVASVECKVAPIRKIRNKLVAHTDLEMALGNVPRPQGLSIDEFDALLESLIELMLKVEMDYLESTTMYRRSVATNAAEHMLFYLRSGLANEQQKSTPS